MRLLFSSVSRNCQALSRKRRQIPLSGLAHLLPRGLITRSYSVRNTPENRFKWQWQMTRDSALNAEVNRLQRPVNNQHNEWRKNRWSNKLESLDSEDQSLWKITTKVITICNQSSPLVASGRIAPVIRHSRSTCGRFGGSILAGKWSIGPGSYWGG
jgi:hypothetical protein